MSRITLNAIIQSANFPKCERCKNAPMCIASPIMAQDVPSYGIPPWCEDCLYWHNWTDYWLQCARTEYLQKERYG